MSKTNDTPFSDLIVQDMVGKVTLGIQTTIELSFAQDFSRITSDEVKRRFKMCEKIFRELRGDLGWSVQRILDNLPRYLRCELDGVNWEPEKRSSWAPSQAGKDSDTMTSTSDGD